MSDDLDVIDGGADRSAVVIGDAANHTERTVIVRPLKVGQVPAFARAVRPLSDEITAMMQGGVTVAGVLALLESSTEKVVEALAAATGAPVASLNDSDLNQLGELLVAVLAANKDFLRGRLTAALKTAAAMNGAGPTLSTR